MNLKQCGNNVVEILRKFVRKFNKHRSLHLLLTPHFVLSQRRHSFYNSRLLPLLVKWMVVWLFEGQRFKGLKERDVTDYLLNRSKMNISLSATDVQMKTLNLTRDWLHSFAPHVLSKINRVHFGILSPEELERMREEEGHISTARRLLAILRSKDVPSRASSMHIQTSYLTHHFSISIQRIEKSRFSSCTAQSSRSNADESGPYTRRKSCKTFANWIVRAGGRVRGMKRKRKIESVDLMDVKTDETKSSSSRGWDVAALTDDEIFQDVWPLQLLDMTDEKQIDVLTINLEITSCCDVLSHRFCVSRDV